MKANCCVVIPVYKSSLTDKEWISFIRAQTILGQYDIYLVCGEGLNVSLYLKSSISPIGIKRFPNEFFKSIEGYSKLLLSPGFYKSFWTYEYILIYQTDCYVFRNELDHWCSKDYDYIGGIWFDNFTDNPKMGAKIWFPGNGGLSLRKVKPIYQLLRSKQRLKSLRKLLAEKRRIFRKSKRTFLKQLLILPLNLIGYQNTFAYFAKNYRHHEDVFFMEVNTKHRRLKIPPVDEAILFSWDRCPGYLSAKYQGLPFACHAWFRDDFPYEGNGKFWLPKIKELENKPSE